MAAPITDRIKPEQSFNQAQLAEGWESLEKLSELFKSKLYPEDYTASYDHAFKKIIKACREGRWQLLQQARIDIAKLTPFWKDSPLNNVIAMGEDEWATHLIAHQVAIHSTDSEGNTALHIAAKKGSLHLIELLTNHIAIDTKNNYGQTPLHVAIEAGQSTLIEALFLKGANVNCPVAIGTEPELSLSPLGLAIMRGEKDCVDKLISTRRCNLRFISPQIGTLLHVAVYFHQFEMLQYLLDCYNAQFREFIEFKNQDDLTPLSFAASLGEIEAIGILYQNGASIDANDFNDRLPIHHAAIGCHSDAIQLLASLGSKINSEDHNSNRPLDLVKCQEGDAAASCAALLVNLKRSKEARKMAPTPHLLTPQNLVFRGGGPKGLAFTGALKVLQEEKLLNSVERIAGTSAGAITAALVAVNYPVDQLEILLKETNLMSFLDHPLSQVKLKQAWKDSTKSTTSVLKTLYNTLKTCTSILTNPLSLISGPLKALYNCTGICDGEEFRQWIEAILEQQTGIPLLTFGELAQLISEGKPYKHLHVYGTRIGKDLHITHIHSQDPMWQDVIISDAVRISMSIPGVFKPHYIHIKSMGRRIPAPQHGYFLDGGMLYNFPVETFDQKQYFTREQNLGIESKCPKFNKRTIGFSLYSSLDDSPQVHPSTVDNVGDLLAGICQIYLNAENAIRQLNPYNNSRVIEIDVKDVGTLSFNMSAAKKDELILSGQKGTREFIQRHNLIKLPALTLPKAQDLALGANVWEKHYGKPDELPPFPNGINSILNEACPFSPNKKIYETHTLLLVPTSLNGTPLTLERIVTSKPLSQDKSPFRETDSLPSSKVEKSYWALVTRNTIPGCYNMTYSNRSQLLSQYEAYEPPKLIEVAMACALEYLENGQRLFPETAPSWMRWTQCVEEIDGDTASIGNTDENGIGLFTYPGKRYGGIIGVRRFLGD